MARMRQLRISQDNLTDTNETILKYFMDVRRCKTLTPNEEYEIAVRSSNGDLKAREQLINANLKFVVSVAKQYSREPTQFSELIAEGNIGLIEAAEHFDPYTGFKFISFAVWHIRKRMFLYLGDKSKPVRLPINITKDARMIKERMSQLSQVEGREVTVEEALETMKDISHVSTGASVINTGYIMSGKATPFDLSGEDTFSPANWVHTGESTEDPLLESDRSRIVWNALNSIDARSRDVVVRKLGLVDGIPQAYSTIGEVHGKSGEWARQAYSTTIKKLKKIQILQSQR